MSREYIHHSRELRPGMCVSPRDYPDNVYLVLNPVPGLLIRELVGRNKGVERHVSDVWAY